MTKGLFLRLPEELDAQFTAFCEREGYKKSGLITKWIRDLVAAQGLDDPIREAEAYGIDLSLLRANLRKSPTERLRDHAGAQAFTAALRRAGQEKK